MRRVLTTCPASNSQNFLPFQGWMISHCMHRPHFAYLVIHDKHLGCFYLLAAVNNTMNTGVHMSLQVPAFSFSGYIPRSGVLGSYGNWMFSFRRNLHTVCWCPSQPMHSDASHSGIPGALTGAVTAGGSAQRHFPSWRQSCGWTGPWSSFYSFETQISNDHQGAPGWFLPGPEGQQRRRQWREDGESTDLEFCLYWDPRVGLLGPQIITEYQ